MKLDSRTNVVWQWDPPLAAAGSINNFIVLKQHSWTKPPFAFVANHVGIFNVHI
jgi:hypothetical protein